MTTSFANYMTGNPTGQLVTIQTPIGQITVHPDAAESIQGFIGSLVQAGAPLSQVGSYNHRTIAGSDRYSQHAYGNAIDLNQSGRNIVSPEFQAWADQNGPLLQQLGVQYGMVSGGDFSNPDFGHWEWNPSYQQADYHGRGPAQPAPTRPPPATGQQQPAAGPAGGQNTGGISALAQNRHPVLQYLTTQGQNFPRLAQMAQNTMGRISQGRGIIAALDRFGDLFAGMRKARQEANPQQTQPVDKDKEVARAQAKNTAPAVLTAPQNQGLGTLRTFSPYTPEEYETY